MEACRQIFAVAGWLFAAIFSGASAMAGGGAAVLNPAGWQLDADHAAGSWDEGYPVGNGVVGALNLGRFPKEMIYLNEDTIWTHPRQYEVAADSRREDMEKAFSLCLKGDYQGAQAVYGKAVDRGNAIATYQCLGALGIDYSSGAGITAKALSIHRRLDLFRGVSETDIQLGRGAIRETVTASHPDQCIAIRLESTCPGGLQCRVSLGRPGGITRRISDSGVIGFEGNAGPGGTKFRALAKVMVEGGPAATASEDGLVIQGGSAATILITAATDYHRDEPRNPRTDDWAGDAVKAMEHAGALGWREIYDRAVTDHGDLMARCDVDLGRTDAKVAGLTTAERLELVRKGGSDPELLAIYFQFGRHMLISSSRPGGLPPNLQGLWEPGLAPMWNGDFHLNINLEMNMWPANLTGLSECNEPLFALMKIIHRHGEETAASLGCHGYAVCLATDAWGQADWLGGSTKWDSFILGGHWLQEHLMEYYRFTENKDFLKETAWPVLKDGALFMLDWMRTNPETGKLICGPGGSPENTFRYRAADGAMQTANISIGNTIDQSIAWETFTDLLECASVLGIHDDFTARVEDALERVQPPEIGPDGRVMEWWKPFDEVWKGHRHRSLLYGLYPGHEITYEKTPALADAAVQTLNVRMDPANRDDSGGHTGWSLSFTANLWARLRKGDKAEAAIIEQLARQTNENLFNRCGSPFQIDGNLGTTAAMAEMLVQSHETNGQGERIIRLLPALPAAWPSGHARGICARGGYVVDLDWDGGKLTLATIHSEDGLPAQVVIGSRVIELRAKAGSATEIGGA